MLKGEAKILREMLSAVHNARVLNVGSSDKQFYRKRQPYVYSCVMAPLLHRRCDIINLDAKDGVGIDVVADCQRMNCVLTRSIDVVLFFNAAEHLVSQHAAIGEIARVLRTDGYLFASAPAAYPPHNDPIDNGFRPKSECHWKRLLDGLFQIEEFRISDPEPYTGKHVFTERVYATAIKARHVQS